MYGHKALCHGLANDTGVDTSPYNAHKEYKFGSKLPNIDWYACRGMQGGIKMNLQDKGYYETIDRAKRYAEGDGNTYQVRDN